MFRCKFHGFTWEIDGRLRFIPGRWDFAHVKDEEFRLPEAKVGTWGGFVFHQIWIRTPGHWRTT